MSPTQLTHWLKTKIHYLHELSALDGATGTDVQGQQSSFSLTEDDFLAAGAVVSKARLYLNALNLGPLGPSKRYLHPSEAVTYLNVALNLCQADADLTAEDVAADLRVSYDHVLRLIRTGALTAYKVGKGGYRVTRAQLERFKGPAPAPATKPKVKVKRKAQLRPPA